ncbi:hypothetical protein ACFWNG_18475 [Streptomyces sp. NPDC058391]|uniref:hypothetical protein n=1 Tax=Streptomyces sp. NPDC058391 TaxID=3346476 RepID=UPI003663A8CF
MTETLPTAEQTQDSAARPVVPRRTVRVVIDAGDDPNLNRRLAALEAASRIVVHRVRVERRGADVQAHG